MLSLKALAEPIRLSPILQFKRQTQWDLILQAFSGMAAEDDRVIDISTRYIPKAQAFLVSVGYRERCFASIFVGTMNRQNGQVVQTDLGENLRCQQIATGHSTYVVTSELLREEI